jgi:hypothetical protein
MSLDTNYHAVNNALRQFHEKAKPYLSEKDKGHYRILLTMAQSHLKALYDAAMNQAQSEQSNLLGE